jgi:uncharacterized protein (TIGR03083 family)
VHTTLEFPVLLRLIDERSTAFRAAIAAAPSLDVQVPTCPEWTLLDLVRHLGEGRRHWATTVAAGPVATRPARSATDDAPADRDALSAWLAASTRQLLDALREAGPDRGCWTWWDTSQSPQTAGAVARHQLQEIAVHTYDAQLAVGAALPLPDDVALDGVEEFMVTCMATTSAWPHQATVIDFHATEGRSWRLSLSADGARATRLPEPGPATEAGAAARGTAAELVLVFYDRNPIDSLAIEGDGHLLELLRDWDPDA